MQDEETNIHFGTNPTGGLMMTTMRGWFSVLLVSLALGVSLGCGEKEAPIKVQLDDAKGLTYRSPVMWKGTEVGWVKSVDPAEGRLLVSLDLHPSYREALRHGVVAQPVNNVFTKFTPMLHLYGGEDPASPILAPGTIIPQASLTQSFQAGPYLKWTGLALGLVVLSLLFRGAKRLIALVFAGLFLAGSLWVLRQQWERHRDDLMTPAMEAKLNELAGKTIRSPEAVAAWESIQRDVGALVQEVGQQGKAAVAPGVESLGSLMEQKAKELIAQGNVKAAEELTELTRTLKQSITGTPETSP
jgi:hypothetical protein